MKKGGETEVAPTDVMTPEQRSRCMSRIKGRDTGPEVMLRNALWKRGLRYRVHYGITGRPDIVFVRARVAVFVDGCFWHGCPEHSMKPKQNAAFWEEKIRKNIERDQEISIALEKAGWRVLRFWEHEIKENLKGVEKKIAACF